MGMRRKGCISRDGWLRGVVCNRRHYASSDGNENLLQLLSPLNTMTSCPSAQKRELESSLGADILTMPSLPSLIQQPSNLPKPTAHSIK